jgi:hypothetical protein
MKSTALRRADLSRFQDGPLIKGCYDVRVSAPAFCDLKKRIGLYPVEINAEAFKEANFCNSRQAARRQKLLGLCYNLLHGFWDYSWVFHVSPFTLLIFSTDH